MKREEELAAVLVEAERFVKQLSHLIAEARARAEVLRDKTAQEE
jgi:hypothetical protein